MSTAQKTDFLKFNAYSIKDLIIRKLSEDTRFTDQIYEGSNLNILIDLVAYMYQCLMYQLNNAASESMFSDTQIYENINRLVNLLGYNPRGYAPSRLLVYLTQLDEEEDIRGKKILPCTRIDTGLTDSRGKKIYFSTTFDVDNGYNSIPVSSERYTNIPMVNGQWKIYNNVFTASGLEYETFVLGNLRSDSEANEYVANDIVVFVQSEDGTYERWNRDNNELFIQAYSQKREGSDNTNLIYKPNDKIYSTRLNENKTYEIKFGNGVTGKKLNAGDKIYILYLDTNGPDGKINIDDVDITNVKLEHNANMFGMKDDIYKGIFFGDELAASNIDGSTEYTLSLESGSTTPVKEDDVNDIRENAPSWFKTGNRLITKLDYEYFIKNEFRGDVIDVKCMNNWDYMTTFYRWLYNMGKNRRKTPNAYEYLTKQRLIQRGYNYVDSADANNIYLWVKLESQTDDNLANINVSFNTKSRELKTMTVEPYMQKPVNVKYDISFTPDELYYDNLINDVDDTYSYLEVTMSDNSIFNNSIIKNRIARIFMDNFSEYSNKIGVGVDYQKILNQIYDINGVERVRTVFYVSPDEVNSNVTKYSSRYCDGLSFASWSDTQLIDKGDDLVISNTTRNIEQFQYPVFKYNTIESIERKIKVIRKSLNNSNPIKF